MEIVRIMPCLDMKEGRVVKGGAQILLAASVFHFRILSIRDVKAYLSKKGLEVVQSR